MNIRTVNCAECGAAFETKSARARFCPNAKCRKAANRRPSKLGRMELNAPPAATQLVAVPTLVEVLEELEATAELLERDLALLDKRFPEGDDAVMDELVGGLETYLSSIAGLRAFVVARCGDE